MFRYTATHESVDDGSTAMLVSRDEQAGTVTLLNEDGFKWTDPQEQWVEL